MTIINAFIFSLLFRWIGTDWLNAPRWLKVLITMIFLLAAVDCRLYDFIAYAYLFAVVRLLPTHGLFSAIHGELPTRDDGFWHFLREALPEIKNVKLWGICYGILRASIALPAMIYIGGAAYLFLAQGAIYWLSGRLLYRNQVAASELACGALFGFCL